MSIRPYCFPNTSALSEMFFLQDQISVENTHYATSLGHIVLIIHQQII